MTQLLDTAGPYACIWDEELPCEPVLIEVGRAATDDELLAFVFSNEFSPIQPAPVPLPTSGVLLGAVIMGAYGYARYRKNR